MPCALSRLNSKKYQMSLSTPQKKKQSHDIMKIFSPNNPLLFPILVPIWTANTTEKFPGSEQMTCNILWSHPTAGSLGGSTFILYSLICGFAIPLSLILVFYYLVIKKLQTVGPKNKSKDKKRSHRKVTRLVLTVITVYILCWSPYWVCNEVMKIYGIFKCSFSLPAFSSGESDRSNQFTARCMSVEIRNYNFRPRWMLR